MLLLLYMRRIRFYLFILLVSGAISCSHDNEELFIPDATINIAAPVENAVVRIGDTIYVQGVVQSSKEIQAYEVAIRKAGGADLFFQHHHEPGSVLVINEKWKPDLTVPADMEVEVFAVLDEQLHKKSKKVHFRISN